MVQTTKLARLRGKRMRISSATNGSRMKAMITAIIEVMKKTRPKYRMAMITPTADDRQGQMPRFLHGFSGVAERLGNEGHGAR